MRRGFMIAMKLACLVVTMEDGLLGKMIDDLPREILIPLPIEVLVGGGVMKDPVPSHPPDRRERARVTRVGPALYAAAARYHEPYCW